MFNKDLFEQNKENEAKFKEAMSNIEKNQPSHFQINRKGAEQDVYVSFSPISLGQDGKVWALVTETPLNVLTEKSDRLFLVTILAGFIGLVILSIILYFVLNLITSKLLQVIDFSRKKSEGDLRSQRNNFV